MLDHIAHSKETVIKWMLVYLLCDTLEATDPTFDRVQFIAKCVKDPVKASTCITAMTELLEETAADVA